MQFSKAQADNYGYVTTPFPIAPMHETGDASLSVIHLLLKRPAGKDCLKQLLKLAISSTSKHRIHEWRYGNR
jgi:hypothetical protein